MKKKSSPLLEERLEFFSAPSNEEEERDYDFGEIQKAHKSSRREEMQRAREELAELRNEYNIHKMNRCSPNAGVTKQKWKGLRRSISQQDQRRSKWSGE